MYTYCAVEKTGDMWITRGAVPTRSVANVRTCYTIGIVIVMAYLHKVLRVGNALGVCLPKMYTDFYRIKRGHFAVARVTGEGALLLQFFDADKHPEVLAQLEAEQERELDDIV